MEKIKSHYYENLSCYKCEKG